MNNLFYVYLKLYPGKTDLILSAIGKAIEAADSLHMEGKERIDQINCHILDALDP